MSARTSNSSCSAAVTSLLGSVISVPPVAYVAITGHAPEWVRIWCIALSALWAVVTVASASLLSSRS